MWRQNLETVSICFISTVVICSNYKHHVLSLLTASATDNFFSMQEVMVLIHNEVFFYMCLDGDLKDFYSNKMIERYLFGSIFALIEKVP